jgi:hypothetical protein
VLAAEHLLDLAGLDFFVERVEALRELALDGFAGLGPLEQHLQVLAALLQRLREIAILFETAPALQDLLRFGLVLPEIGRRGACLETMELFFGFGGFKDSYADLQRAG